ncbi:MAG: glycosyltransferase [Syntrophobacteraceae bacterium]
MFKPLRHKFRSWRNKRRLEKESAHYGKLFRERGLSIPSDAEIKASIGTRFPAKVARKKANLHILAIYHDFNWEGASLGPALAKFGATHWLDWCDPVLAGGKQPDENGWKEHMNAGLLRIAAGLNANRQLDVIFTYLSGDQITPQALRGMRELAAPIVNLALNDKEAFVGKIRGASPLGARDICRHFDLCWTSTHDALEKYVVEGATPIYLPEGANPEVHRPYNEEKIYDVSFVGQCYGNRPEVISGLRNAGVRVETFGPGWPNGALSIEEMVRTWSRSRINLGFGGVLGYKETFCLKGRDFEVPMSGGVYLTEHHDELAAFYEIGREIVTYTDFRDLLQKIHYLLDNPDKAEVIRIAGLKRALGEHTWEMRFERVFRILGILD